MSDKFDSWSSALGELGDAPGQDVLRLRPDEEITIAFLGGAQPYKRHYSGTVYEACIGDRCPYDHERDAPQVRVLVDVYLFSTAQTLVFEASPTLFSEMARLRATHSLDKWSFRIGREGVGMETRYQVTPCCELTAEQLAIVAAAPRHDLAARIEAEKARALKKLADADTSKAATGSYDWTLDDDAKGPGTI